MQAMTSDEAEAALSMGACKEAQAAYTVFVSVVGDFKANRCVIQPPGASQRVFVPSWWAERAADQRRQVRLRRVPPSGTPS